jgi:hypothetical protein
MTYVIIVYHGSCPLPGSPAFEALGESDRAKIYADYAELNRDPRVRLRLPPIAPTKATTVQVRDGLVEARVGPHLAEGIGGAFVVDVDDERAAIELVARIPQARLGGAIELRPVETYY